MVERGRAVGTAAQTRGCWKGSHSSENSNQMDSVPGEGTGGGVGLEDLSFCQILITSQKIELGFFFFFFFFSFSFSWAAPAAYGGSQAGG